ELDPDFSLAHLELAFSYMKTDTALMEAYQRAVRTRCPTLGRPWQIAFETTEAVWAGDAAAGERALAELAALPGLSDRDRLYFETRWAFSQFYGGAKADGTARLEWIAEAWPADPAAPKLLASALLDGDDPAALADARRYAEEAPAWAPHDLALRADLARALLLLGDEAGARAHARIIDGSDPAEKQSALSGNEWQNSIAALHMELGDRAEADRDARRLLLGSLTERGQGSLILASIAIQRGAYRAGIDRLAAQADESEAGGIDTLASNLRWRAAWAALHTGELARARELLARIRQEHWRPFRDFTLALAAARAEPRRREAHLTAAVEALEGLRPGTSGRLEAELILAHEQRTWHRVIELERALRDASRPGGPVARYSLAAAAGGTRGGARPSSSWRTSSAPGTG